MAAGCDVRRAEEQLVVVLTTSRVQAHGQEQVVAAVSAAGPVAASQSQCGVGWQ